MISDLKIYSRVLVTSLLLGTFSPAAAQEKYSSGGDMGTMLISGTSNLHDWEMDLEDFQCILIMEGGNPSNSIQSVQFSGKSESIKSKSSIMDKKTYDALHTAKYPEIMFNSSSSVKLPANPGIFEGEISGYLSIAGTTRSVSIPFSGMIMDEGDIQISGSENLRMSEYNIEPPTAIMGTLKTGDVVTVSFSLLLEKNSQLQTRNQTNTK